MSRVLIIDDDRLMNEALRRVVAKMGHEAVSVFGAAYGLERARNEAFDVVFLDVCMPDGNGLELLPLIRETVSVPEVIIITGYADPDGAEKAIRGGAWDYVQKPSSLSAMTLSLLRALEYRRKKRSVHPIILNRDGIVGESPALQRALEQLALAAQSDENVLITGETGTGKEVFARGIHRNSSRVDSPFVVVDCAALPETLVESILFGHKKGAFTGAERSEEGLIRQAHGGTLFFDEVGELSPGIQKTLLRVLQEQCFRPVGAEQEVAVDFRFVAATNRDLDAMAAGGGFRSDLLYRLRNLQIEIPSLRNRSDDVHALVVHYVHHLGGDGGGETKGIAPEFFEAVNAYEWPGNVRELINALRQAMTNARGEPTLFPWHLPTYIRVTLARNAVDDESAVSGAGPAAPQELGTLKDHRARSDREYLERALAATGGNINEACRIAGISRTQFFELRRRHGLVDGGG